MYLLATSLDDNSIIIWPFIVIIIICFLIWTEDGSQNLKNRQAHHHSPPINYLDSNRTIISKTQVAVSNRGNVVGWRRAMLISIILTLGILFFLNPTVFPHGFTVLIISTIIFLVIYFTFVDFQSRYISSRTEEIDETLTLLKKRFV